MISDKQVAVKTKLEGTMQEVGKCTIPLYPETVKDVVEVFKSTPDIALKCLQNGLTIEYQRILRNEFAVREAKPSKAKLELIAKTKATGYYKEKYETMTVTAITSDILATLPKK